MGNLDLGSMLTSLQPSERESKKMEDYYHIANKVTAKFAARKRLWFVVYAMIMMGRLNPGYVGPSKEETALPHT